ncbi:periplasmic nitrate reductase, NapE protein [Psychromarinibacter sp. C21-152]|uniref:Periplasmic nitrate reductase, NapE protein n=1 Tax=Psychromarinibacter sediminicola TaxID=3033385 RepID=A0AAE3TA34_9RHOB|nr:periplasmic nitrate reductase, NapE protein [Psychromarinibacter sediminicola]MDF0602438.1 periplasmic nitrate reductase, NapE protein [Psychromarinibacter sediminicola]
MSSAPPENATETASKRHETLAFLFLAFVLFPVLAIVLVGGFGFIVWMQHLMFGPPGV